MSEDTFATDGRSFEHLATAQKQFFIEKSLIDIINNEHFSWMPLHPATLLDL